MGFQPVILASANQCVCPGGHIWLCYQFIYCIYLLAQAGFLNATVAPLHCNSYTTTLKKLQSKTLKVVFSHLESDAEKKRCEIAKNNVRLDKAEFASTYFYTFALNKKFCKGTDLKNYQKSPKNDFSSKKIFDAVDHLNS